MTEASRNQSNAITFSPAVLMLYKKCPITDKMKYEWTLSVSHILNVQPQITIKQIQVYLHLLSFTCIPTETFNSVASAKIQSKKLYKYTFFFP